MRCKSLNVIYAAIAALFTLACLAPPSRSEPPSPQVVFVCQHGNVKSLMAASYFNQLAQERGLAVRAISRASAPDSTTVPPAIIEGLRGDGFDVSAFRPAAVTKSDVSASRRVVTIGTSLPFTEGPGIALEQWDDVPAASVDYGAARDSLRAHVRRLVEQLARR
jgi:hypothetical protein